MSRECRPTPEPITHVTHVTHATTRGPDVKMVEKGKELCEDLLANVREQFEQFKNRPPRGFGGGPSGGGGGGGYGERPAAAATGSYYGGRGDTYDHQSGAGVSASPAPGTSSTPSATDYAAQYSQYYGTNDPYAAYGGYAAYDPPAHRRGPEWPC